MVGEQQACLGPWKQLGWPRIITATAFTLLCEEIGALVLSVTIDVLSYPFTLGWR